MFGGKEGGSNPCTQYACMVYPDESVCDYGPKATMRQATHRQSIPPLGPRATMRSASGDKKASGFRGNLLIPIAFAGVGALVSKNKVKGAILGLVIPFVVIEGIELLRGA